LEIRIKNLEKESFHKNGDELEEKIEELNKLKLEYDNL
jgi:hypothetical protein